MGDLGGVYIMRTYIPALFIATFVIVFVTWGLNNAYP